MTDEIKNEKSESNSKLRWGILVPLFLVTHIWWLALLLEPSNTTILFYGFFGLPFLPAVFWIYFAQTQIAQKKISNISILWIIIPCLILWFIAGIYF